MTHLDEHTLTRYVLGSPSLNGRRREIKAHLTECHGCRELEGRIRSFYVEVADNQSQVGPLPENSLPLPIPRRRESIVEREEATPVVREVRVPATRIDRMKVVIYRHPVASAGIFFTFALFAFFGLQSLWTVATRSAHSNPAEEPFMARINDKETAMEVLGQNGNVLWQHPVVDGAGIKAIQNQYSAQMLEVADLDGDGHNEVITFIPFNVFVNSRECVVRIFDRFGTMRLEKDIGHAVNFRGADYVPEYSSTGVLAVASRQSAGRELLLLSRDNRSPSCITRMDQNGKVLGEYWHFGHLNAMKKIALAEGQQGIALCGVNDVGEEVDSCYPCVTILDPSRIAGLTESSLSAGFGYAKSQAEIYCIRFPRPDLAGIPEVTNNKPGMVWTSMAQDGSITFQCASGTLTKTPYFSYTLDSSFRPQSVWLESLSLKLMLEHHARANTPQKLDAYLNDLKGAVRFWDGRAWVKEPTRIAGTQVARK